jgi:predicted adenine nucleotide alpha hydrolase (AANH) superfamily ATPase
LIFPLELLKLKGFQVSSFFYNPNIHPLAEYQNRRQAMVDLKSGIDVIYPEYLPHEFFRAVNLKEEPPARCAVCWKMRLKKTAHTAREKGFKYFTTTLLVSPYQDHEVLKRIGTEVAQEEGAEFYYADFRPGFRKAHEQAKASGIYCQKYCGCLYSEMERAKSE